jgi:hypothetical protein
MTAKPLLIAMGLVAATLPIQSAKADVIIPWQCVDVPGSENSCADASAFSLSGNIDFSGTVPTDGTQFSDSGELTVNADGSQVEFPISDAYQFVYGAASSGSPLVLTLENFGIGISVGSDFFVFTAGTSDAVFLVDGGSISVTGDFSAPTQPPGGTTSVPEPSSLPLLGGALIAFATRVAAKFRSTRNGDAKRGNFSPSGRFQFRRLSGRERRVT